VSLRRPIEHAARGLNRIAPRATLVGLSATAVLMAAAGAFYPGGTWAEQARVGHAFWENFWCDLLRERALNGHPNPVASELALLGMVAFGATTLLHWLVLARRLAASWARWVLATGILSSLAVVLLALTPSDRFSALHAAAVVGAGPAFFAAAIAGALGQWRDPERRRVASWALVGVGLTVVNVVQYARQVYGGADYAVWLPAIQKGATLCFVAWILGSSWREGALERALPERVA